MIFQNRPTYSYPYAHLVSHEGFEPLTFSADPTLSAPASLVLQDKRNQFKATVESLQYLQRNIQEKNQEESFSQTNIESSLWS